MAATTPIIRHAIVVDIPFYDVDAMGITWHGHYLKYLERARCALLELIDYDYQQMKDSGYSWPVVDVRLKYIRPTTFKQRLHITAAVVEYENRLKIDYHIHDSESGVLLSKGYSIQVAVDQQTRRMCYASPSILHQKIQECL